MLWKSRDKMMPKSQVDPRLNRGTGSESKIVQSFQSLISLLCFRSFRLPDYSTYTNTISGLLLVAIKSSTDRPHIIKVHLLNNGYPFKAPVYLPLIPTRTPFTPAILNLTLTFTIAHPKYDRIRKQHPNRTS